MPPELRRRGTGPRATSSKDGKLKRRKGLDGVEEADDGGVEVERDDGWMWATGRVWMWPSRRGNVGESEDMMSAPDSV
jgi:hypothetical protein